MKKLFSDFIFQESFFLRDIRYQKYYENLVEYVKINPNFYKPFKIYSFSELSNHKGWGFLSGYIIPFGLDFEKFPTGNKPRNYIFYLKCNNSSATSTNTTQVDFTKVSWELHADYEDLPGSATIFNCCGFLYYKDVDFQINKIERDFIHFLY